MKVDDPYMVQELPETLAAVYVHKGPSGYRPPGPAMQVFKGDLMSAPEMELRFPIAR